MNKCERFAIVGAIIGGGIGTYLALICGYGIGAYGIIICGPVLGVIGGVVGGLIGGAIHRDDDSAGRSCLSGCLSLLGLGFLGLISSLTNLIFWLVIFVVADT